MSANRKSTSMTTAPTEHNPPPMGANPDTHRPDLGEPADGGPGPRASGADDDSPRHVAISGAAPGSMPGASSAPGPGRGGNPPRRLQTSAHPPVCEGPWSASPADLR
jgi:hypothetical protein